MNEEFINPGANEELKAENDFLKLKIMAERGGEFYSADQDAALPAEIENEFLNNIVEFEKQYDLQNRISVYEKIGKPTHFNPVAEIPDEEIEDAWQALSAWMSDHGVELSACSPRITPREMYRFATEELFQCETDDINIPGMLCGFIYDEFYPDHGYDNARVAADDCIAHILRKAAIQGTCFFAKQIHLNNHLCFSIDDLTRKVNQFKDAYDEIELKDIFAEYGEIKDVSCAVRGNFSARAQFGNETVEWKGNWLVEFEQDDSSWWYIVNIQIEGINF